MVHASDPCREAYQRYGPALLRKCQRMLQSRQESEDVVQGLFVDLLASGKEVLDLPYLYRAVTNRCLNLMRYGENRQRLLQAHDEALRGPVRTTCDEQVIRLDLLAKLSDRLDERCCEVLVFRYFDDMSTDEIASLLGTSRRTVGKRLQKIRQEVGRLVAEGNDREVGP